MIFFSFFFFSPDLTGSFCLSFDFSFAAPEFQPCEPWIRRGTGVGGEGLLPSCLWHLKGALGFGLDCPGLGGEWWTLACTYPCFHLYTPTLHCSKWRMNNHRQIPSFFLFLYVRHGGISYAVSLITWLYSLSFFFFFSCDSPACDLFF